MSGHFCTLYMFNVLLWVFQNTLCVCVYVDKVQMSNQSNIKLIELKHIWLIIQSTVCSFAIGLLYQEGKATVKKLDEFSEKDGGQSFTVNVLNWTPWLLGNKLQSLEMCWYTLYLHTISDSIWEIYTRLNWKHMTKCLLSFAILFSA